MVVQTKKPLYVIIHEALREDIASGKYAAGKLIPSESELCKRFDVTRPTVRKAISGLIEEGLLRSIHGKGVFVTGRQIATEETLIGGFESLLGDQLASELVSTRIVSKAVRNAGPLFSDCFGIDADENILRVTLVRQDRISPISLEENYLNLKVAPSLMSVDFTVFSLSEAFRMDGIVLDRASETLDLVHMETRESSMLDISAGDAVMLRTSVLFDTRGNAVAYSRTYTRGDRASFVCRLGGLPANA